MQMEIKLTELLAGQHEAGREIGFEAGLAEGQRRIVARLKAMIDERIRERGRSPYDTCRAVLEQALERCSATVADVTPQGVDRG